MRPEPIAHAEPATEVTQVGAPAMNGRAPVSVGRLFLCAAAAAVLVFLLLPSLLVVVMSFGTEKYLEFPPRDLSLRWYETYLGDPDWIGPTLFSLRIAGLTSVVATAIGTLAALAIGRGQVPGRAWINATVVAPMVAPGIIVAIALYLVLAPLRLVGTTTGFVLAHVVLTVPYVVLSVSASLARFDPSLELAAMSLGAPRPTAVLKVTLPLVLPGVLTGAAFAFIVSFDEAVVSFFLSGVSTKTLPKKIFEDIDFDVSPTVAAVGTLLTGLSLLVMGGLELARARAASRSRSRP